MVSGMVSKSIDRHSQSGLRVTFILLTVLLSILAAHTVSAGVPVPTTPKAKGEQCVEETDFMRRNHMDLLDHQRDATMHQGIRTRKHSLNGCLNCHVVKDEQNQPVTYKSEKHFCNSCHQYAAVKIDCFGCHTSVPGDDKALRKTAMDDTQ